MEEPIDVWVHRPIAYIVARACMPTPISPNVVTLGSILLGIASGLAFVGRYPSHLQVAGACLFFSAVLDCADGQLARMRETSSRLGRMLDGTADLVVTSVTVSGATWVLWQRYSEPRWIGALALAAIATTAVTSSFHTTMYDHYKNVFLRLTTAAYREGESYETALARSRALPEAEAGLAARLSWPVYLFYLKGQEDYVRGFDPFTARSVSALPAYTVARAEIYERHAGPAMRLWRGWFGFGSLVFGISAAAVLDVLEWYMVARLVLQNAAFFGYLRPMQRRASEAAFREMGVSFSGAD